MVHPRRPNSWNGRFYFNSRPCCCRFIQTVLSWKNPSLNHVLTPRQFNLNPVVEKPRISPMTRMQMGLRRTTFQPPGKRSLSVSSVKSVVPLFFPRSSQRIVRTRQLWIHQMTCVPEKTNARNERLSRANRQANGFRAALAVSEQQDRLLRRFSTERILPDKLAARCLCRAGRGELPMPMNQ